MTNGKNLHSQVAHKIMVTLIINKEMSGSNSTTQLYKMLLSNVSNFLKDFGHLPNAKTNNITHNSTTFTSTTTASIQNNIKLIQVMLPVILVTEVKSWSWTN
jgi:hypothetical protein